MSTLDHPHLTQQEQQLLAGIEADVAADIASSLIDMRSQLDHVQEVMRLNMTQQQAYHRLLGQVFTHHKDCEQCLAPMKAILEMIAQNIDHQNSLLPEDEQYDKLDSNSPGAV